MTRKAYPPCRQCQLRRRPATSNLCVACYRDPALRQRSACWATCVHCGRARKAASPVPLCNECKKKPSVARQHGGYCQIGVPAEDPVSQAIRELMASERPRVYPPAWQLPKCEHGLEDGECAACEKRQRAVLVMDPNTDQEDDDSYTTDED